MREAHHSTVSGVPAFWRPGDRHLRRARLLFRAGQADEQLRRRGWLHLLQHLALLDPLGDVVIGGSVGLCFTSFNVEGSPYDVATALNEISRRLTTVSADAVARASNELEKDSLVRGEDPLNGLMRCRWGARGPGVMGFRELGLAGIDADELAAYGTTMFAAKNAALAFDGPVPRSAALSLPPNGALLPVTLPPPLMGLPTALPNRVPAASGIVSATSASRIMVDLLAARLNARHRPVGGSGWTFHVDQFGDELHVAWLGPASSEGAVETSLLLSELERIASGDVPDSDIAALRQARRQLIAADARRALARRAAKNWLLGHPDLTEEALAAEAEHVSPRDVWEAGAQWRRSVLVAVADPSYRPATLPWNSPPTGFTAEPGKDVQLRRAGSGARPSRLSAVNEHRDEQSVEHTRLRQEPANSRVRPSQSGVDEEYPVSSRLRVKRGFLDTTTVTLSGSELRLTDGRHTWGADLSRIAVLTRRPDGLRAFIPEAGRPFELETSVMRAGKELRALIDSSVPAERQITLDARPDAELPHPAPWALLPLVDWLNLAPRRRRAIGATVVAVLLVAGLSLLAVSPPWSLGPLIATVVAGLLVGGLEIVDSARRHPNSNSNSKRSLGVKLGE